MKIAIIIINFNGGRDTLECLDSIRKLTIGDFQVQVIVVDNASTDGSLKNICSKKSLKLKIIKNKKNLGFAEGNNVAIRWGLKNDFDYFLLLNNDALAGKNLLVQLIKEAERCSQAGVFSPKIYFAPGFEYHKQKYKKRDRGRVIWYAGGRIDWDNVLFSHRGVDEIDKGQYQEAEETAFATGCCMFVKKEVFQKIGLFDKRYFLYLEDADLSVRAKKAGFKVFYLPKGKVWHKNASSSQVGGELQDYYFTRNRLLFACEHASLRTRIALFKQAFKYLFQGNSVRRKAVKDFLFRHFGKK